MSAQPSVPTEKGILQFLAICDAFYPSDAVEASIEQQRDWYDALCARFDRPLPPEMIFADGMLGGEDQVGRQRDLKTAAATDAVDRTNDRLVEVAQFLQSAEAADAVISVDRIA